MSNGSRVVIVGGCGHVGLPLGVVLAARGRALVDLLDIDENKIAAVNAGRMPFLEAGAEVIETDTFRSNRITMREYA